MKKIYFSLFFVLSAIITNAQVWQEKNSITSTDGGSRFGYSVSLNANGDVVAIGNYDSDLNGNDAGHTEIYSNDTPNWNKIGLNIIGEAASDLSGYSVSMSADGNIVAIGAPWNDGVSYGGHVRVFKNIGGTWTQLGNDIDGASWDISGSNVSLSADGNTLALSAASWQDGDNKRTGYVKIFSLSGNNWTQKGSMLKGENAYDQFGTSLNLSKNGGSVAVGAHNANNDFGYVKVYNFESSGNTWVESTKISGEFQYHYVGYSVSLNSDGSILAVGSREKDDNSHIVGHTRIYRNNSGNWSQIGGDIKEQFNEPATAKRLELNEDGTRFIVGINYGENNTAKVYKNINDTWLQIGSNLEYVEKHGVSINNVGNIIAVGSTSASVKIYELNNDLRLNSNKIITYKLYPNPSKGYFSIEQENIKTVEIINFKGQTLKILYNINSNKIDIDLSNNTKGIYFIKIISEDNFSIQKLILK